MSRAYAHPEPLKLPTGRPDPDTPTSKALRRRRRPYRAHVCVFFRVRKFCFPRNPRSIVSGRPSETNYRIRRTRPAIPSRTLTTGITMRVHSCSSALLTLSAIVAVIVGEAAGKPAKTSRVAKYTTLCKRSDPQLSKCMANSMQDILKYAKTGIPELKIPALEPFVIEELDLKVFQGLSALVGGNVQKSDKTRAFARNLTIHHSSEFILHDLKTDIEKKEFYFDLSFPILQVEGEYDVNLMMFNLPIKSTGPVYLNATESNVKSTLYGKTIKRKGETYLMFDNIDIKVDFKDYSIQIERLFKKDQNLNRALNDMIKSQKAELRKLALPMIEEVAGKLMLNMANLILSDLPMEELFVMD